MATELAEDVHVRVALPVGEAGMLDHEHASDSAHLEADGANDGDGVVFMPPRAAGRAQHCGVGRPPSVRAVETMLCFAEV